MVKSYQRSERVSRLIQHELAMILLRHATDFNLPEMSITKVDISRDLSHAKVFISVYDAEKEEVMNKLTAAAKNIRHLLAEKLVIKKTPELKFIYDESLERGRILAEKIDAAVAKDQARHKE